MRLCRGWLALFAKGLAQIGFNLGVVRSFAQIFVESGYRFRGSPHLEQCEGHAAPRLDEIGCELQSFFEMGDCLLQLVAVDEEISRGVLGLGIVGVELDRPFKGDDRVLDPAVLVLGEGEVEVYHRRPGIVPQVVRPFGLLVYEYAGVPTACQGQHGDRGRRACAADPRASPPPGRAFRTAPPFVEAGHGEPDQPDQRHIRQVIRNRGYVLVGHRDETEDGRDVDQKPPEAEDRMPAPSGPLYP